MQPESGTEPTELDLRFDETDASSHAPPSCSACNGVIASSYYEAGGAVVCPPCKEAAELHASAGTGTGRLARAALYGLGGAIAGAALYYAIVALTGYEVGLVAIAVGWMVGRAVQIGSAERGGRLYQGLAVLLTYLAIVSTYVPFIVGSVADDTTTVAEAPHDGGAESDGVTTGADAGLATAASTGGAATDVGGTQADAAAMDPVSVAAGLGLLLLIAMAAPFLAGFENIIGIAIIGFALYQAWQMNARRRVVFTGPYAIGGAQAAADG